MIKGLIAFSSVLFTATSFIAGSPEKWLYKGAGIFFFAVLLAVMEITDVIRESRE